MGSKPQASAAPAQPSARALDRAEHHRSTTAPMGSKPQALATPAQPSAAPPPRGAGPHGAPPRRHGTRPVWPPGPPFPSDRTYTALLRFRPRLAHAHQTPPCALTPLSPTLPVFSQIQTRSAILVSTRLPRLSAGDCENSPESRPLLPSQQLTRRRIISVSTRLPRLSAGGC